MKRTLMVSVAAAMLALPLAAPSAGAQPNYNNDHRHDNDRHDNDRHDNDRNDNNRHDDDHGNWDPGRHNGYMWQGRWHYGRPPVNLVGRPGYSVGWHQWRRGDRVPVELRRRYVVVNDWRVHRLRPPPRGYHWVRDDRGEYILVGIATGLILSAILNNG